ncbi:MAG TPA: GNAT family N-acetyltransferase [Candidatus Baltobacteraceae bacterium]
MATLFDVYRQTFGYPSERTNALAYIRGCVSGGEVPVFTAYSESRLQEPLGFTILYPTFSSILMQRTWQMQDLFVIEGARRRGIARALVENAIKFARQQGADEFTLLSRVESEPAAALFASLGFEPYGHDVEYHRFHLALSETRT